MDKKRRMSLKNKMLGKLKFYIITHVMNNQTEKVFKIRKVRKKKIL